MTKKLRVWTGNITTLKVDAIVNAANSTLLGGGGVDGAIHRAAGPQLLEECRTLQGCSTGEAKITHGYNLPAKWVIHTVGPVYRFAGTKAPELLASCYRRSLEIATEAGAQTIAFPAISCGVYGYPLEDASQIAVKTIQEFLKTNSTLSEVILVAFDNRTAKVLLKAINQSSDSSSS